MGIHWAPNQGAAINQPKYHIDIFWSDEDGSYIANVPDLRHCLAFGETYEEALRKVLRVTELYLHRLRKLEHPAPEPASRHGGRVRTMQLPSGQVIEIDVEAGGPAQHE